VSLSLSPSFLGTVWGWDPLEPDFAHGFKLPTAAEDPGPALLTTLSCSDLHGKPARVPSTTSSLISFALPWGPHSAPPVRVNFSFISVVFCRLKKLNPKIVLTHRF
jgi:hypothetical protein